MKKIIIALVALMGVANANEASIVWDLSFNGDSYTVRNANGENYNSLTLKLNGATIENGVCTSSSANRVTMEDSSPTLRMMDNFSYVIQGGLNNVDVYMGILFGLGEGTKYSIMVRKEESGLLGFYGLDYVMSNKTGNFAPKFGEMGTYIVTVDNHGKTHSQESSAALTLYYNGVEIASASLSSNHCTTQPLDTFAAGGQNYHEGRATDFSFTNIQLYSGLLSQEQIAQLSVPEPTTATLGAFALVSLLMRRRRR